MKLSKSVSTSCSDRKLPILKSNEESKTKQEVSYQVWLLGVETKTEIKPHS